ncbi:MAG: nucleoside deaminase [Eubacteriales bacterium]
MTHREEKIAEIMRSADRSAETAGMTQAEADGYFMSLALEIGRACAEDGEVPVGCVIVRGKEIISCGGNGREATKNALHHAEVEAINSACTAMGGWRLPGVIMYVTLEPCVMCAGAIINARISRVVYAARDAKAGAMGSVISVTSYPLGFRPRVEVLEEFNKPSAELLRGFFGGRRNKE